ncbi:hypothetical protein [Paenibacillus sp. Cedars]|uniref:hypothetical protein n=1 Tax=Paenibacillus sp. Cedars TaxID=1980674 RepID=UPI001562A022|nr:hypothetical protein [Paenibacillus sp. Cedars]
MEYSNKHELNKEFQCVLCGSGEHGIGKNNKFVCFDCIKELVIAHDLIVKQQIKIQIKK